MKTLLPLCTLVLLCACSAPSRPQGGPGAAPVGAPASPVSASAMETALLADRSGAPVPIRLPDRITLPAAYRLILLEGHLSLVRETDAQAIDAGSPSQRIVTGEIARGELAYQPGLLPQELSAALAADRESCARMDRALDAVMKRSRALSEQATELEAQGKRLAELLAASESRERQPGPQPKPAAATPAAEPAAPKDPQ
jgi:uncharacterized coiled-coil protein SlyX